jgi:hypothetical protein
MLYIENELFFDKEIDTYYEEIDNYTLIELIIIMPNLIENIYIVNRINNIILSIILYNYRMFYYNFFLN